MISNPPLSLALIFYCLTLGILPAQSPAELRSITPAVDFKVESRRTVPLQDGSGRKLIMERVQRPVFPTPPAVAPPATVDPVLRAARREARALEAKKERRLLSLNGIYYPNGQTFLSWFTPGPDGVWQTYEAWTLTDLRSAWLVQEFEVGDTIYHIFASVHPASKWDHSRALPGPLYFPEGAPGFRLIKGNPSFNKAIEPLTALHEIYRQEGSRLTSQWLTLKAAHETEVARLKANPPPVKDILVRYWPGTHVTLLPVAPAGTGYRRRQ